MTTREQKLTQARKGTLAPLSAYSDIVQDFAEVIYDTEEQAPQERFVDFALRLSEAMEEAGLKVVRSGGIENFSFSGRVHDAGLGQVIITVDRNTTQYPVAGADVTVEVVRKK